METIEEVVKKLPSNLQWKIINYLQHPLAEVMKPCIALYNNLVDICGLSLSFPKYYFLATVKLQHCNKCQKFLSKCNCLECEKCGMKYEACDACSCYLYEEVDSEDEDDESEEDDSAISFDEEDE